MWTSDIRWLGIGMPLMDFMLLSPAAKVLWSSTKGNNLKFAETQSRNFIEKHKKEDRLLNCLCDSRRTGADPSMTFALSCATLIL